MRIVLRARSGRTWLMTPQRLGHRPLPPDPRTAADALGVHVACASTNNS